MEQDTAREIDLTPLTFCFYFFCPQTRSISLRYLHLCFIIIGGHEGTNSAIRIIICPPASSIVGPVQFKFIIFAFSLELVPYLLIGRSPLFFRQNFESFSQKMIITLLIQFPISLLPNFFNL